MCFAHGVTLVERLSYSKRFYSVVHFMYLWQKWSKYGQDSSIGMIFEVPVVWNKKSHPILKDNIEKQSIPNIKLIYFCGLVVHMKVSHVGVDGVRCGPSFIASSKKCWEVQIRDFDVVISSHCQVIPPVIFLKRKDTYMCVCCEWLANVLQNIFLKILYC